jgi:hypothetical protein
MFSTHQTSNLGVARDRLAIDCGLVVKLPSSHNQTSGEQSTTARRSGALSAKVASQVTLPILIYDLAGQILL